MKKKQKLAKALLSSVIVTSLAGAPAYAASTTQTTSTGSSTVKTSFPDVASDYWGLRHISKLALEGIIEGYEDGAYRAENSVNQQEVLVMAIRMMGLEEEAKSMTSTTVFPDFLTVDNYARNYVAIAREKGLISYEEEKARADEEANKSNESDSDKVSWGQRPATREWVAEIVIRVIGKESLAEDMASSPTDFKDNNDISYSALGSVNAAVSLGIVDGFEDGTFKPKGVVTRAQMAAFLSRSENDLESLPPRVVKGYLSSITSNKISLMDEDGNISTYKLNSSTVFYGNKDDNPIDSKTLQETYEISLVQVNGTAYYVEVLDDELKLDIFNGKLLQFDLGDLSVVLYEDGKYNTYKLSPDVAVMDKDGKGLSFSDLVEGSVIELRRSQLVDSELITSIIVKQVPVNKSSEGTVEALNNDSISILETSSGESETYSIAANAILALSDNTLLERTGLHVGDAISYDVVNNEVVKIVVTKQADVGVTVDAVLKAVSDDKTYITVAKTGGTSLDAYYLSDNVQVKIDGMSSPSVYDLEAGDTLKMDVLNNKVTNIVVTDRTVENLVFAKIISYDEDASILTVQDEQGSPHAYQLTESATTLLYDDDEIDFSKYDRYFKVGKRVDLKVSKDTVTTMELSSELEGTITQLNTTTKNLTVKTSSGQSVTFKMEDEPYVAIPRLSDSDLTDLKVGDEVKLELDNDQEEVQKITMSKDFMNQVSLVNSATEKVTVTDDDDSLVLDLDDIPVYDENENSVSIKDIPVDDYLKVSYEGETISKVQVVQPIRGKVTAVNTASSSMTVVDFSGKSHVIGVGNNYSVSNEEGDNLDLSAIKVDDRVKVMRDVNDKLVIVVASALDRVVSSYDNVLNQMTFQTGISSNKLSYNLFPRAYYHKGDDVVTASSFVNGDVVKIYVLDNKIVEIEKP